MLIALGCAAFLAIIYILAKQGVSAPRENPAETRAAIARLKDAAAAAETAWLDAEKRFTEAGAQPAEADLQRLDAWVDACATLESKTIVGEPRLPALTKHRDNLRGKILHDESLAVEKSAIARENANDYAAASTLYLKAAGIERLLAEKFPDSDSKNIGRIVALESRAKVLRANPLWEQSKADEAEGDARRAAGDHVAAKAAYDRAWASHTTLDSDYRGITPADLTRTHSLGRKRADAGAEPLKNALLKTVADAESMAAAGRFDDIPALRAAAETALAGIVKNYPESTYANEAWSGEITRRIINAHAARDCLRIDAKFAAIDAALTKGDFNAASGLIEGLATDIARVRETFKGGDRPDAEALEHARFLQSIRDEIALIHKIVAPRLRSVPGRPGLLVSETETTQALYALILHDGNPSAVRGDTRPVESVTRPEAEAFCKKLGWALGRRVRLPDEAEFRAIAADTAALPRAELAATARAIETGDGSATAAGVRPHAPSGIRDALGNVAEWISGTPSRVAGGDAESSLDQLATIPVREQPATRRSRFVGFRFVVESPTPNA